MYDPERQSTYYAGRFHNTLTKLSYHPKPSYPDTEKQTSGKENKQSQENGFKTISPFVMRLSLSSWSAAYKFYHIFLLVKHAMVATRQNGDTQILHPSD